MDAQLAQTTRGTEASGMHDKGESTDDNCEPREGEREKLRYKCISHRVLIIIMPVAIKMH